MNHKPIISALLGLAVSSTANAALHVNFSRDQSSNVLVEWTLDDVASTAGWSFLTESSLALTEGIADSSPRYVPGALNGGFDFYTTTFTSPFGSSTTITDFVSGDAFVILSSAEITTFGLKSASSGQDASYTSFSGNITVTSPNFFSRINLALDTPTTVGAVQGAAGSEGDIIFTKSSTVVPEPSALLLGLTGSLLILGRRTREPRTA